MIVYVGRRDDGRAVYADTTRRHLLWFAGPTGNRPSPRRYTICVYGDGSTRQPSVGQEVIGHPVFTQRVNVPRRFGPRGRIAFHLRRNTHAIR